MGLKALWLIFSVHLVVASLVFLSSRRPELVSNFVARVCALIPTLDAVVLFALIDATVDRASEGGPRRSSRGARRVQLAIVKLSAGQTDRVEELIAAAKREYRDVLMWAEYPEEGRAVWAARPGLTGEEGKRLPRSASAIASSTSPGCGRDGVAPSNKRRDLTNLAAAPVLEAQVPPPAVAAGADGRTSSQLIRRVAQPLR
jgi:hypothetical protein